MIRLTIGAVFLSAGFYLWYRKKYSNQAGHAAENKLFSSDQLDRTMMIFGVLLIAVEVLEYYRA